MFYLLTIGSSIVRKTITADQDFPPSFFATLSAQSVQCAPILSPSSCSKSCAFASLHYCFVFFVKYRLVEFLRFFERELFNSSKPFVIC